MGTGIRVARTSGFYAIPSARHLGVWVDCILLHQRTMGLVVCSYDFAATGGIPFSSTCAPQTHHHETHARSSSMRSTENHGATKPQGDNLFSGFDRQISLGSNWTESESRSLPERRLLISSFAATALRRTEALEPSEGNLYLPFIIRSRCLVWQSATIMRRTRAVLARGPPSMEKKHGRKDVL